MRKAIAIAVASLLLAGWGAYASNSEIPSGGEKLIAQAHIYKHIPAMKWQRGQNVGTVTVKMDTKTGECFFEGHKLLVTDNSHYTPWDSNNSDPLSQYNAKAHVHWSGDHSFDLYFNI